jgi:hypothetical protein
MYLSPSGNAYSDIEFILLQISAALMGEPTLVRIEVTSANLS